MKLRIFNCVLERVLRNCRDMTQIMTPSLPNFRIFLKFLKYFLDTIPKSSDTGTAGWTKPCVSGNIFAKSLENGGYCQPSVSWRCPSLGNTICPLSIFYIHGIYWILIWNQKPRTHLVDRCQYIISMKKIMCKFGSSRIEWHQANPMEPLIGPKSDECVTGNELNRTSGLSLSNFFTLYWKPNRQFSSWRIEAWSAHFRALVHTRLLFGAAWDPAAF
jgi:hypothetical protein